MSLEEKPAIENPNINENEEYYLEDGKVVFTSLFLLKRGYCCKSGCRHCPYGEKKENLEVTQESKAHR
ncbi:MAG: hypothetical protein IPM48_11655 [Saprospiraceae bacterium]|nr:hypothetical protein [Saprospiraceae bacterium]